MDINLEPVAKYFWDCDFAALTWQQHQDFIIRRILQHGDINALRWLRAQVSDEALKAWIIAHHARGLSPRHIRYWALMLDIDSALADQWVEASRNSLWEKRR